MHIAMVSEHADPLADPGEVDVGGQNVHVAHLAAALVRRGHRVAVYTRRADPHGPDRVRADAGYAVVYVPAGPPRPLPKDELLVHMSAFAAALGRHWCSDRPDVVHAHFWMSGLAAVSAARPLSVPVVQTYHALGSVKRRHQGAADTSPADRIALESRLGTAADAIVATCTDEVAELLRLGMPRRRITVVPCGVDLERFSGADRSAGPPSYCRTPPGARGRRPAQPVRRRVVTAGRLVPRKGFETLIRALAAVPEAELVIAGGPDAGRLSADAEARRLAAVARRAGVADRVQLAGRVDYDAMPALLRSADVVACTPWYEPFGIVPLEAMACERPVLASAVGGLTDTVIDEVTGLLVPPRDARAAALALRTLCRDDARRFGFGLAGHQRVQARYSWDRIAADTEAVYRRIVREADLGGRDGAPARAAGGSVLSAGGAP